LGEAQKHYQTLKVRNERSHPQMAVGMTWESLAIQVFRQLVNKSMILL